MKAKLFVRGQRDPFILSQEEGNAAQAFKRDETKPESAVFSITGVVTVTKGEMRYVMFGEKEPEEKKRFEFSDAEARAFEEGIKSYLVGGKLTLEKELDLLAAKGYYKVKKLKPAGQCKTASDFDIAVFFSKVDECGAFEEKLDAWKDWRGKKEYGKDQGLMQLEKYAGAH